MLLGFGARNYYSFKEGFELSLLNKKQVLTVLGIKGANASGKTNVIRTLSFLRAFITSSFSSFEPDNGTLIKSFFESDEPTDMYIHFEIDNIEYKYEVELTELKIMKETLWRKDKRWTSLLVREEDEIKECINELKILKTISLNRLNASIVSIAHQYGLKELDVFYNFAANIETNVNYSGRRTNEEHFLSVSEISEIYFNDEMLLNLVGSLLNNADTGINRIEIVEYTDKKSKEVFYEPFFKHKVDGVEKSLEYQDESTGVQMLYRQLGVYLNALRYGMLVAFDEFDIGIHPDLLPMIIELFENDETKKTGAQLIFTSHHTEIIDQLGKYNIVFVNKEDNESYLYRLDEIPGEILRPDRSLIPAYNSHKIGGRPRVVNG